MQVIPLPENLERKIYTNNGMNMTLSFAILRMLIEKAYVNGIYVEEYTLS